MNHEDENPDNPLISQVREENEKSWKSVMKSVFIEVSLCSDEEMLEESAQMFTKL